MVAGLLEDVLDLVVLALFLDLRAGRAELPADVVDGRHAGLVGIAELVDLEDRERLAGRLVLEGDGIFVAGVSVKEKLEPTPGNDAETSPRPAARAPICCAVEPTWTVDARPVVPPAVSTICASTWWAPAFWYAWLTAGLRVAWTPGTRRSQPSVSAPTRLPSLKSQATKLRLAPWSSLGAVSDSFAPGLTGPDGPRSDDSAAGVTFTVRVVEVVLPVSSVTSSVTSWGPGFGNVWIAKGVVSQRSRRPLSRARRAVARPGRSSGSAGRRRSRSSRRARSARRPAPRRAWR